MRTNLLKTILICTLSLNLLGCIGDNIAEEMKNSTAQINELKQQIVILNSRLVDLQNVDADISRLNVILLQILDILRKLPPLKQQEVLDSMSPEMRKLIIENMKD